MNWTKVYKNLTHAWALITTRAFCRSCVQPEDGSVGHYEVQPAPRVETGLVDDSHWWKDWNLESHRPGGLEELTDAWQEPDHETGLDDDAEISKAWNPGPCGLDMVSDGSDDPLDWGISRVYDWSETNGHQERRGQ